MKPWPRRKIGEVARVLSGATPKTKVAEYWNGNLLWVTPKDLGALEGIEISSTERRITQTGFDSSSAQLVPAGSVVMSSRAPIGHLAINTSPVCTNQGCKSFVPSKTLDTRFLYWTLRAFISDIRHLGEGCTFDEVSKRDLEKFEIPVPPIVEQRRIVVQIEDLTGRIEQGWQARQAAFSEASIIFQRVLANEFADEYTQDWDEIPATDLFDIVSGQVSPLDPHFCNLPYLGPEHVESGTGRIIGERRSVAELEMKSGKYYFSSQHVVYSKIRPALHKVCLPDYDGLCSADMYALKPNLDVTSREFLLYLLLAPAFSSYAEDKSDRNAMPKINQEALFGFTFRVPKKAEQKRIVLLLIRIQSRLNELQRLQAETESDLAGFTPALLAKVFKKEPVSSADSIRVQRKPSVPSQKKSYSRGLFYRRAGIDCYVINALRGDPNLGRTKLEKITHFIESHCQVDLERTPVRDAAGPDDYPSRMKTESLAVKKSWYSTGRRGSMVTYVRKHSFSEAVRVGARTLWKKKDAVDKLIQLMRPLDTKQCEIIATLYGSWNDFLLGGVTPTDDEIIHDILNNWQPDKLLIKRTSWLWGLKWLRDKKLIPTGRGKPVLQTGFDR